MKLIIDADPIVYRCGFAAEEHSYQLVVDPGGDEELQQLHFGSGDEMKVWKKDNKALDDPYEILDQEMLVTEEPVENALHIVGQMLRGIVKEFDDPEVIVLLSGPGNFRDAIATVKPYKGNRKEDYKPVHYQAIRNYMTQQWSAIVIEGREADDEVSILARQADEDGIPFVVATIDKDLDQVPGLHYDYVKKVKYTVDLEEAEQLFWQQALAGDSTDNIPGATRIGPAAARKLVDGWYEQSLSQKQIWERVVSVYEATKSAKGCLYTDRKAADVALEMARLVFMQEYVGQLWTPAEQPDEMLPATLDD